MTVHEKRTQKTDLLTIGLSKDGLTIKQGSEEGVSWKVLANGAWGFASATSDSLALKKAAERLTKIGTPRTIPYERPQVHANVPCHYEIPPVEELIPWVREGYKLMDAQEVTDRTVNLTLERTTSIFESDDGSRVEEARFHAYLRVKCGMRKTELAEGTWVVATQHPLKYEDFVNAATHAKERAYNLLRAVPCKRERMTVILDPHMTGVLSHEAVGHACEADGVIEGESILQGKIGAPIGNELVSIVDDPTATDFGSYVYDDEGVRATKTVLVEKGVLKGYINSISTGLETKEVLNGHARAMGYDYIPQVRMSNTYFQPGNSSLSDVFDVKSGVFLKGMKGGSVDIYTGGFMFRAAEAWEIKNGEKVRPLKEVTITGNILETLQNVRVVGKDFGTSPGICGKSGQEVPVSDGGPHVQIHNVSVG